jgi:predicted HD superfamily hydrolase involved in NAD metabolism
MRHQSLTDAILSIADEYLPFLENALTPLRLWHSLGVMQVMGELAKIYELDRTQALLTGLLHDAAKDLSVERQLALAEEVQMEFQYECERHPVYLHAPIGAYVVFKELGITDALVLSAISAHSDGDDKADMDLKFQLCLQAADILAPISEWHGMKKFRQAVYTGRLEEAALLRCHWLLEYFDIAGVPIHPNLQRKYRGLLGQLKVAEDFFERW